MPVPDAANVIEAIAKPGFRCPIEGHHHGYSDRAKRTAELNISGLRARMLARENADHRTVLAQLGDVAAWQLRSLQSTECAAKLVEGKAGIPSVLYKYIPADRIGRGAPRSLRATQPSALNDEMECSIVPMGGAGPEASEYRAVVGAQLQDYLGVTMSKGELAKLWMTSYGDMKLSGFIREHLDSRVGVVSFSRDPLVPTMWAHYAQNTGVTVGYDTEALTRLGFDLRSVVYLETAPMYEPMKGAVVQAAFIDREAMDRDAAAGKVVLSRRILCSVDLTTLSADWKSLTPLLFVKGTEWAYEREVRLVVDLQEARDTQKTDDRGQPVKVIDIPPEAIREIYRGPRTPDPDMARAIKEARGEHKEGLYVRGTRFRNLRVENSGGVRH